MKEYIDQQKLLKKLDKIILKYQDKTKLSNNGIKNALLQLINLY